MRFFFPILAALALAAAPSALAQEITRGRASCNEADIAKLKPDTFCQPWDHLKGEAPADAARKSCVEFYQASVNTLKEICAHQDALEKVVSKFSTGARPAGGQQDAFDATADIARDLIGQYQVGRRRIQNTEAYLRQAFDRYAASAKEITRRGINVLDAESRPTMCGVTGSRPSLLFLGVSSGTMAHAGQAYSNVQSLARVFIANATHNARVLASVARQVNARSAGLAAAPNVSPEEASQAVDVHREIDPDGGAMGTFAAFVRGLKGGISMETITRTAERLLEYGVVQAERSRLVQDLVRAAAVSPDFAEKVLGVSNKALASAIALGFLGIDVAHRMLEHGRLDMLDYVFLGAKLVIYMGFATGTFGTGTGAVVISIGLEGVLEVLEHSIRSLLDADRENRMRNYLSVMGPEMRQLKDLPAKSTDLSQKFSCIIKEQLRQRPQALPTLFVTHREHLDSLVRDSYAACCAGSAPR